MNLSVPPIVIYGMRYNPENGGHAQIIFNCILPGVLIQMEKGHEIFCVTQTERCGGYELEGTVFEDLAHQSGDQTYRLAKALERTEGLNHLYILQSGLIALGGIRMKTRGEDIMTKMRQVLEEAYGSIQFKRATAEQLWMPSYDPTRMTLGEHVAVKEF